MGVTHEDLREFQYEWLRMGGLFLRGPLDRIAKIRSEGGCLIPLGLPKILRLSGVNFGEIL